MALTLVTAPAIDPVSLADVRAHLKIETALEDATLLAYIQAAVGHLEGRDGWLGRALISQTWDWTLDGFPPSPWPLVAPLSPLQSVTSVKYIDPDGVEQTLSALNYQVDTKSEPGRILPAFGLSWPATRRVPNAVTVRFVAGYGNGPAAVPRPIRLALLGLVGDFYEHRDVDVPPPAWVEALLAPYRVWL